MSDEMVRYGAELERLRSELDRARKDAGKYRSAYKKATEEVETYKKDLTKYQAQSDEYKALKKEHEALKAAKDPEALKSQLSELQRVVKQRNLKDTYDKLATEKGVRAEARDRAYKLLGLNDDATEEMIQEGLSALLTEIPELAGGNTQAVEEQPLKAGPGLSRGAAKNDDFMLVTEANTRDINWMRINGEKMAKANREGRMQYVMSPLSGSSS